MWVDRLGQAERPLAAVPDVVEESNVEVVVVVPARGARVSRRSMFIALLL